MAEPPPPNYCYITADVLLPGTRWLDNHRGCFLVSVEPVSSVHTLDKYLDRFVWYRTEGYKILQIFCRFLGLNACLEEGQMPLLYGETSIESELKKSIAELNHAQMGPLVRFLPLILDKLLTLMVRPPVVNRLPLNLGQTLLEAIAALVHSITVHASGHRDAHSRHSLLASYIQVRV